MSFAEKQHCSRGLERQDGGPALAVFTSRGSTRFSTVFPFDTLWAATSVPAKHSDFMCESWSAVGWLCFPHRHNGGQTDQRRQQKSYIQRRWSLNSDQSRLAFLLRTYGIVKAKLQQNQDTWKLLGFPPNAGCLFSGGKTAPSGEMVEILSCGR